MFNKLGLDKDNYEVNKERLEHLEVVSENYMTAACYLNTFKTSALTQKEFSIFIIQYFNFSDDF